MRPLTRSTRRIFGFGAACATITVPFGANLASVIFRPTVVACNPVAVAANAARSDDALERRRTPLRT
jgi:hypothetical protein